MVSVKEYISKYGGETMRDLPEDMSPEEKMHEGRDWINRMMDEGRTIVDLGPDPSRENYPYITGHYYGMERAEIAGRGYAGWLPIFGEYD